MCPDTRRLKPAINRASGGVDSMVRPLAAVYDMQIQQEGDWLKLGARLSCIITALIWLLLSCSTLIAQNATTGALTGTVTDVSGALVPTATIKVINDSTGEVRTSVSQSKGDYWILLLPAATYTIEVEREGFKTTVQPSVQIRVTETTRVDIQLQIGKVDEKMSVVSNGPIVRTESAALGNVVEEKFIDTLPLVTRNYTQILGLSPGVTMDVTNAGELGRGSEGSQGNTIGAKHVNGGMQYDNNFEINGVQVNDAFAIGVRFGGLDQSGGIPVPNPDTLQEFKVQTGQYDAEFGRNAGSNVQIITKQGGNEFHGTIFEFFRNEALNANDFFRKLVSQGRPELRENQFGFTFGGPLQRSKLLFFSSYQRTQQKNAVAAQCSAVVVLPPLTNDRSRAGLGSLFAGLHGALDEEGSGVSILSDGSNINPVALQLLQMKLSDGSYLIPTPQSIDPGLDFLQQGFSSFSQPCTFNEDQLMANVDYIRSANSTWHGRSFFANDDQITTFADSNVPTLAFPARSTYRNVSLAHTYIVTSKLLNQTTFGYNATDVRQNSSSLFSWSSVGVTVPQQGDTIPIFSIPGSINVGSTPPTQISQHSYNIKDTLALDRGTHSLRFGGDFTYSFIDLSRHTQFASLSFLSFPDFLLGMPGGDQKSKGNGTPFSNVASALNFTLLFDRRLRSRHGSLFAQDDYRAKRNLTINLGLRYEHIGDLVDGLGRISNFDINTADPDPPDRGSLRGFVVASNYSGGTLPDGVRKSGNNFGIKGRNQNVFAPRVGFAWNVWPTSNRLVVRGGYGIFYTQPPGFAFFFTVLSQPWSANQVNLGTFTPTISFQEPFIPPLPTPDSLPQFHPYSPSTGLTGAFTVDQDYRPGYKHQFSFNLQSQLASNAAMEVGYVGARAEHVIEVVNPNQASLASADAPVHGVTTNEFANIGQRVRILGFAPTGITLFRSEGASWYNALQASLKSRAAKRLQILASYTFSRTLSTAGANTEQAAEGSPVVGNQLDPGSRYGRSSFDRTHRLVISYLYQVPGGRRSGLANFVLNGWEIGGVTTVQSGRSLSITATNPNNVYGITNDLAQLSGTCARGRVVNPGSVSHKLNHYFNPECFTTKYPVVGSDDLATDFGNGMVGIASGPAQHNFDIVLVKRSALRWPSDSADCEFRTEFFNAFNTPQFSDPGTVYGAAGFGRITSLAVNPRIVQFALKFNF